MSQTLARTGFYVSLISYMAFWLMDLIRPGFVGRSFSVHVFLLATIVFGIWWSKTVKTYIERPWVHVFVAGLLGVLLAGLVWTLGEGYGALRFIVVLIALFTPLWFLILLSNE